MCVNVSFIMQGHCVIEQRRSRSQREAHVATRRAALVRIENPFRSRPPRTPSPYPVLTPHAPPTPESAFLLSASRATHPPASRSPQFLFPRTIKSFRNNFLVSTRPSRAFPPPSFPSVYLSTFSCNLVLIRVGVCQRPRGYFRPFSTLR